MCDECGKHDVAVDINEVNDRIAHTIGHALKDQRILCVNIMGAPGAGKTTLLEHLAPLLGKTAVIQGDLESDVDKIRLEKSGIMTHQINTHSGCHLNADMINKALIAMNLAGTDFLFIENVGNLVCPAGVKIGQHMDIVVSSTAEGSDKPKKYPHIFLDALIIVISKSDMAGAAGFDESEYRTEMKKVNPKAKICSTTVKNEQSFEKIAGIIRQERENLFGHEHQLH